MNNAIERKVDYYPNNVWIGILAVISFAIATPFVKSNIGFLGIVLFFLIAIVIQKIFNSSNTLFLAWVALSPTIGQGIYIGSLTFSVMDIIALSYLIRGNLRYIYINKNISKAYLIFTTLILFSYFINPKLANNVSIYKELLLMMVLLKYSLQKHTFDDWLGIVKSLQSAALCGILLFFTELITKGPTDGNIFRVSSINAIHQYIAIGIISNIYIQYQKGKLINTIIIIVYSIFTILSLSRTGLIYDIIIILFFIYSWFKLRKINLNFILPFAIILFFILIYFGNLFMLKFSQIREGSNIERLGVIIYYLNVITHNLWWGIGFGNWQQSALLFQEGLVKVSSIDGVSSSLNPHNTFLRLLTDSGLFATLSFIYIFFINYNLSKKYEFEYCNTKFFTSILFFLLFLTFFLADNLENTHSWACLCLGTINTLKIDTVT